MSPVLRVHLKTQIFDEPMSLKNKIGDQSLAQRRQLAYKLVRAEALSMCASDDLRRVLAVLFREMTALGIRTHGASVDFYDFDNEVTMASTTMARPSRI